MAAINYGGPLLMLTLSMSDQTPAVQPPTAPGLEERTQTKASRSEQDSSTPKMTNYVLLPSWDLGQTWGLPAPFFSEENLQSL